MIFDNSYQNKFKIGAREHDYYQGSLIRADNRLHEQISDILSKKLKPGSKILDMGCGQGALSKRLQDLNFKVLACDTNKADLKVENLEFYELNFNSHEEVARFMTEHDSSFDAVIGVEVIEHLENPWDYIRSLKKLTKKDGLIIVSTPNVSSWYSRMIFLFTGKFPGFVDPDLVGHINPITPWELNVIAEKSQLKVEKFYAGGDLPIVWLSPSFLKSCLNLIFLPIYPFTSGLKLGWCTIAVFRK